MVTLEKDTLVFSFPEVHPCAVLRISLQRTLRIPDDGKMYPLPPGLGGFPLVHVDDFEETVPKSWIKHGGVMLPMYQSEALWINFDAAYSSGNNARYQFAVKVATGKVNAVTGKDWRNKLKRSPQDYLVIPRQPWLDGYCVGKGYIRQFVAMPLGAGYTAEEQVSGEAEHGGLQIAVYPMKSKVFAQQFQRKPDDGIRFSTVPHFRETEMGLSPGGKMKQQIFDDPYKLGDWDQDVMARCYVHIANSLVWSDITSQRPPTAPFTSRQYAKAGLPWFDYYNDQHKALTGSSILANLKSIVKMDKKKGNISLPENKSVTTLNVKTLGGKEKTGEVREGEF